MLNIIRSSVIKERQIKAKMRYSFTPIRIAIIKSQTKTTANEEAGNKRNPHTALAGMLRKTVCRFLKVVTITSPPDSALPLLGMDPREMKTYEHTKASHECHRTIIHKSPHVETTQTSVNWGTDE